MLTRLNQRIEKHEHKEWIKEIETISEEHPLKYNEEGLTGPYVIEQIYKVTEGNAIITTDVGQHQMWAAQYYKYKNIYPQYEFDEINASKLSQHDLIEKVKSLDSDTILIYIMCSSDKDGNTYIDSQGIKLVSENAPVPTFSIVSIGMGKGVIGGEMVSQKEMAKIAASMVQQYFNGTDVSSIEVQTCLLYTSPSPRD